MHPGAEIQQDATDLHLLICKSVSRDVGSTHWPTWEGRQQSLLSRYHQEYHTSNAWGRPRKNRPLWWDSKSPHHNFCGPSEQLAMNMCITPPENWSWSCTMPVHVLCHWSPNAAEQALLLHESQNTRLAPKYLINHKFWVHTKQISTLSLQTCVNSGCFFEACVKQTHAAKPLNQKLVLPKLPRHEG